MSPVRPQTNGRHRIIARDPQEGSAMSDGDVDAKRSEVAALSASARFNAWAGFEVLAAGEGRAELKLAWRPELGQYAGFLHAAMIGGMIDTACGFAAYSVSGHVLASHFSVSCFAPAAGDAFVARARVVKAGRRQVFAHADLFALNDAGERLVAAGDAILVPVGVAAGSPRLIEPTRERADASPR
jgi:uncharacterized protein (TIGR00369 family)